MKQSYPNKNFRNVFSRKPGRSILCFIAGMTAIGGFLADFNRTHLFNPDWPPHAKFHDAMTISLSSILGGSGLYFLMRQGTDQQQDTNLGALLPAFFWMAQGVSFLYPGAKGAEAEFPELIPRFKGIWINEKVASISFLALSGLGYYLEHRRLVHELTF